MEISRHIIGFNKTIVKFCFGSICSGKVCKFFIQAIEECKYGWFWVCPNGGDKCMYRHALPVGFVLKSQKKKQDEQQEEQKITIEELIEQEV